MRVMGLEAMRRHRLTPCQSVEFFAYRESQVGESGRRQPWHARTGHDVCMHWQCIIHLPCSVSKARGNTRPGMALL